MQTKKIVALVLGLVIVAGIAAYGIKGQKPTDRKAEVEEGLAQMNKSLPKMIDSMTRLDSVATSDGTDVIYHYTVVGAKLQYITSVDLQPMKPQVIKSYCTNPQLQMFREHNMTLKYMYYLQNASLIGELDAAASDCPATTAPAPAQ